MLLSDALDAYTADRRVKGIKPSTRSSENSVLRSFLAEVGNIHVHSLKPVHMDRFWASKPNYQPATFNRVKAQLSTFFKWAQVRGHLSRSVDLLEGVGNRRIPSKEWTIIPQSQFGDLLDAASNGRDRVLLAFGLYLFTRVSETRIIRWQDLDFDRHTVSIYRTKTDQADVLPMCEELEAELRRWRLEYASLVGEHVRGEWLVCPRYSGPKFSGTAGESGTLTMVEPPHLKPSSQLHVVVKPIKAALDKLGIDGKGEGGHTLRRSGAIALYHQLASVGHDRAIRMCQAMLGHSSIQTTEVYLALNLDRKARNDLLAGKRMFPGDGGTAQVIEIGEGLNGPQNSGVI